MDSRHHLPFLNHPPIHPPSLSRLPQPISHPNPSSLPPSTRYKSTYRSNLQEEADSLEWEEDQWAGQLHDTRAFGFSWMIPLGRQNTQEEDVESSFSSSPRDTSPLSMVAEDPEPEAQPSPVAAAAPGPEAQTEQEAQAAQEGDGERDLDGDIEDADAEGTGSEEEEEEEDDDEEEEEEDDDDEEEEESAEEAVTSNSEAQTDASVSENDDDEEGEDEAMRVVE